MTEQHNFYNTFFESEYKCESSAIIIFGSSGDLTRRKLMPSLFNLFVKNLLPAGTKIIGVSRTFKTEEEFRTNMKQVLKEQIKSEDNKINEFVENLFNINGDIKNSSTYKEITDILESLEQNNNNTCGNRLFYLSVPPETYDEILDLLYESGLSKPKDESSWTRVIIEKPFGHDLQSADELNKKICRTFNEEQIYRIDHYLGKETVQNILALRFANGIFEPIWNRNYIDHVQITSSETIGIGTRGNYYEQAGALRDMVQNHLLQLVAHTAMEPPATFIADKFRDEKVKIFDTIKIYNRDEINKYVVRGQYKSGVIDKEDVQGYKEEKDVAENSNVETFAALKLYIQNWRWADVPFYIRTGKRLKKKVTEINLVFRQTPHFIFQTLGKEYLQSNILSIEIQPKEGISLKFAAKYPGPGMEIKPVKMDFTYEDTFKTKSSDSYERLLIDCLAGDQTLYSRKDAVMLLWKIVDPILKAWKESDNRSLPLYSAGSWGPKDADDLIEKDGRKWYIMH